METMYWASMMGIIGGVSASILIVCIVVAVFVKLRRQNNLAHEERNPNKIDKRVTTMTTSTDYHQHEVDDPDIIINSNSGKSDFLIVSTKNFLEDDIDVFIFTLSRVFLGPLINFSIYINPCLLKVLLKEKTV